MHGAKAPWIKGRVERGSSKKLRLASSGYSGSRTAEPESRTPGGAFVEKMPLSADLKRAGKSWNRSICRKTQFQPLLTPPRRMPPLRIAAPEMAHSKAMVEREE